MNGPLEGHMDRHPFDDLYVAVLAARAKADTCHLFAQVEDEDGNVLVGERDLATWTAAASSAVLSCPRCSRRMRVPRQRHLTIRCVSCTKQWVQRT